MGIPRHSGKRNPFMVIRNLALCAILSGCFAPVNDTRPYHPPTQVTEAENHFYYCVHVVEAGVMIGLILAVFSSFSSSTKR